jgi:hypothetical protein
VVDSSVGRALSSRFKSRHGHLFVLLLIYDLKIVKLMSINGWSIHIDCWLMLEPIGQMNKTLNHTMYAERDHLKIV